MKYIGRKILVLLLVLTLSFFVFLAPGQNEIGGLALRSNSDTVPCSVAYGTQDIQISSRLWELLFGNSSEQTESKSGKILLISGGGVFGAKIKQAHLSVSDPGTVKELKSGDRITHANGREIHSALDLKSIVKDSDGRPIELTCKRSDKTLTVAVTPKKDGGEYTLGITLKDGAAGIGTVTYIDPKTGLFGGLGHGICDPDTGELVEMASGEVTGVILGGVKKGESGKPGELSGILTDKVIGELYANTECGIFGRLERIPTGSDVIPIEVARKDEVHAGEATIISTVKNGQAHRFKIEISEVNTASTGTKSFRIRATDPALTAITGGVVRGMSGSPIIQDGKLVGAVTHVMVANPTEGYGIFIENMLNASQHARNELPAA